jgi:hypothetical protein
VGVSENLETVSVRRKGRRARETNFESYDWASSEKEFLAPICGAKKRLDSVSEALDLLGPTLLSALAASSLRLIRSVTS